jgi:hypothetical protein
MVSIETHLGDHQLWDWLLGRRDPFCNAVLFLDKEPQISRDDRLVVRETEDLNLMSVEHLLLKRRKKLF